MLRAATFPLLGIPAKFWGFVVMAGAIVLPAVLPWLDRSPVKSIRYKGMWYKVLVFSFAIAFIRLGMLGMAEGTPAQTWEMRFWTFIYFIKAVVYSCRTKTLVLIRCADGST